jgi:hypothetical protein
MPDDTSSLSGQTGDARPAPGAMNAALGRRSTDLASDQSPGFGPDPIAGVDDRDTFSDADAGGGNDRAEPLRADGARKFNPDIPPDARMGLSPTIVADPVPDHPVHPVVADPRTRAATGFLAGAAAAAVLAAVAYVLALAGGPGSAPSFVAASRVWLGTHGGLDHALGTLGFLVAGGLWGALFALVITRPNVGTGMLFGIVPTVFLWLVVAPLAGAGLFMGGTLGGILLPLLANTLIWGGVLGYLCDRWLSPPSTAAL